MSCAERISKGSGAKKNRNSFLGFIQSLIGNKNKARGRFVAPSWDRAQKIALDELKTKLEKYDWEKADVSVVKFRAERNLAYLVVEVHDIVTYARPVKVESYILVISKIGDIQSFEHYNINLAIKLKLI